MSVSITCGSCKGTHTSSAEVKACYQSNPGSAKRVLAEATARTSKLAPKLEYSRPLFCAIHGGYHVLREAMIKCSDDHHGKYAPWADQQVAKDRETPSREDVIAEDKVLLAAAPYYAEIHEMADAAQLMETPVEVIAQAIAPLPCPKCKVTHRPGTKIAEKHAILQVQS